MFNSPFGSIFSEEVRSGQLGFLGNQAKPSPKNPAPDSKIEAEPPTEKPPAPPQAKPSPKIEKEAPKKAKQKPFSSGTPQFRAATTMKSEDPAVKAEQSKILVEKNKQRLAALTRRVSEIRLKIQAAKIYRDVLAQYTQLSEQDKEALHGWVIIHDKAIKKLSSSRKLKILEKDNIEMSKALDAEIVHWENLAKLKKKGVKIQGRTTLKNFRPTTKIVPASPKPEGSIPKFKGTVPVDEIVRLKKKSSLQGFNATDEAVASLSQEKPKKTYKEIFMGKLPGKYASLIERDKKTFIPRMVKRTEKTMILSKQYEWQADQAEDELEKLSAEYNNIQENLSDLIGSFTDAKEVQTTAALGVLLEARPERFLTAPTLLQASMNAFTRLSSLGDVEAQPDPESEADKLLQEASLSSTASLEELETRQNTLAKLQAEVEDKPAPPPIQISVEVVVPEPPKKTKAAQTAGFINKALPWIALLFILKKLMEG
jgi:hypothetical protein